MNISCKTDGKKLTVKLIVKRMVKLMFCDFLELPFGQLPILKIDNCEMLCQSHAISRYLAKEFGKSSLVSF